MSKKLIYLISFALVLGMGFSLAHGQEGLIGYWKFDESSGTIAADSAGGDNDGTLSENVEWQPDYGRSGGALLYDGTNTAHVEFPTTGMSATVGTVAVWGNLNEPQPSQVRYFFGHTTQPSYNNRVQLYMDGSNTELDLGLGDSHTRQTNIMVLETETWYHVALTWDNGNYVVYVDGEEVATGTYTGLAAIHPFAWIGNDGDPVSEGTEAFGGMLDEVKLYDRALTADQIRAAMRGEPFPFASSPDPKVGSILLDTWANISWSPGDFAVSHDVYLGDNFDDVNDGAEGTFQGNQSITSLLVGFPGFAFPDGLVPGTTYYWRIDEVNDLDPNSPWKGKVWSFAIAPKTAYNPDPADGAESIDPDVELNWTAGFGSKLHYVYFGDNFDDVNNAAGELPQGVTTYTPGPLKLAKTYYWRVDEFDAFDMYKGDVWSFTTQGAVGDPNPSNGAVDVERTPVLTWSPGVYAASHQVYFGTDKDAVSNADTSSPEYKGTGNLGSESYNPGKLQWYSTYYWRIDEANNVNPDSPWTGKVWSFTTADFIVIDDFEDYNDYPPDEIFSTWIDGWEVPTNGSMAGHADPPFAETTIVHGGGQSMPLYYDNNFKYSEATMTLVYPRDWTEEGVGVLSLWFYGDAANAAERMYVALNGSAVVYHSNPDAALIDTWTEWTIDLQEFAAQGVNLANVNTISIGFGDKNNLQAGGSGMVFFDDIRLYRPPAP